jgi:hypothetical protein
MRLTGRMADLRGKRFGDLQVVAPMHVDRYGVRWSCICRGCGDLVERHAGQILAGARAGRVQSCRTCANEYRAGARAAQAEGSKIYFRKMWQAYGCLYGGRLEDINVGVDALPRPGREPMEAAASKSRDLRSQLDAYLIPISSDGGWKCEGCMAWFTVGSGCILCMGPICDSCVSRRRHRGCRGKLIPFEAGREALCEADERWLERRRGSMTLREVGRLFGVDRERARQIEATAIRKLRHPSRAPMLKEFAA